MEERNQFTFYRSFWEAVEELSDEDRLAVLTGIIHYALDEKVPVLSSAYQRSMFTLCKPILDTARKKAKLMKAVRDEGLYQEKETKKELETENEKEGSLELPNRGESGFESFWHLYPRKEGKEKARQAYRKCNVGLGVMLEALGRQISGEQWNREGGRYVPLPATWLNQRRWEDEGMVKPGPSERRPDAKERLAVRRLMESEL